MSVICLILDINYIGGLQNIKSIYLSDGLCIVRLHMLFSTDIVYMEFMILQLLFQQQVLTMGIVKMFLSLFSSKTVTKEQLIQLLEVFARKELPREEDKLIEELKKSLPQLVKSKNQLVELRKYKQNKEQSVNYQKVIHNLKNQELNECQPTLQSLTTGEKQRKRLRIYQQYGYNEIKQPQEVELKDQKQQKYSSLKEVNRLNERFKESQVNSVIEKKDANKYSFSHLLAWIPFSNSKDKFGEQKNQKETEQQNDPSHFQGSKDITNLECCSPKNELQKNKKQQLDQQGVQLKLNNRSFGNQQAQLINNSSKILNHLIQLEFKLKEKEKDIKDLRDNLDQTRALQTTERQIAEIQQVKLQAEEQIAKQRNIFKEQKQQRQKIIWNLGKQLENQKAVNYRLVNEIQLLKEEVRKIAQQWENQKRVNRSLNTNIEELKGEARKTVQQWENQKRISFWLNTRIEELKGEVHKTLQSLERQKEISNNLSQEIQNLRAQTDRILTINRYESLFTGDVLDQSKQCKEYLTTILQQKTERRISKTKLIYRFDRYSKSNFHQYFDNKEQLVLLVRTNNDFIFGGWTEGGFIPKTKSDKSGLLFSLTNKKCFELSQPNRKAITYDEFNIIFGNSEIAIQSLKNQVFSNFGIKNGFYNCQNYTVDLMLGAGEAKEVKIKTYEMFQLSFQK